MLVIFEWVESRVMLMVRLVETLLVKPLRLVAMPLKKWVTESLINSLVPLEIYNFNSEELVVSNKSLLLDLHPVKYMR